MKLAYYPGCSLDATAVEYGISTRRTARVLGVELEEIDGWNCCGATSAHSTNRLLSLALPARNLALAEKEGLDVLAPCAACYNRFRATEHQVQIDSALRTRIQEAIGMEYKAENRTWSILELLADKVGLQAISDKITRPLKGMKPACYYGCLLVRPSEYTGFDNPEYPQSMDNIMRALGARPIAWSHQTECCGASLATTRPEVGLKMTYEVLKNALERGADSIVTACPLCQMNLDMRQAQVEKKFGVKINLPIYYITELVAVACGESPQEIGINRHFVEALYHITHLPEEIEEPDREAGQAAAAPKARTKTSKKTDTAAGKPGSGQEEPAEQAVAESAKAPDSGAPAAASTQPGPSKGAVKLAERLFPEDNDTASRVADIFSRDPEKMKKVAQIMAQDKDKAVKVAQAFAAKEARSQGQEVNGR